MNSEKYKINNRVLDQIDDNIATATGLYIEYFADNIILYINGESPRIYVLNTEELTYSKILINEFLYDYLTRNLPYKDLSSVKIETLFRLDFISERI